MRATPYDGRHTFASLLIHEGRALPYVTAAMGHASPTTTLPHYAHVFDDARLAPATPMVAAIRARAMSSARLACTRCVPTSRFGSSGVPAASDKTASLQRVP